MADCPSRFSLVQWKGGDLAEAQNQTIGEHVAQCATCQKTMREIEANIGHYRSVQEAHLAQLVLRLSAHEPPRPSSIRWRWWTFVFGGAAVTAIIALAVIVPRGKLAPTLQNTEVRFKGSVALQAVAKRGEDQFAVQPNATLLPRDALRFIVTTGSGGYLSVFSVDSRSQIASFYPDSDPSSNPNPMHIEGAGPHELPGSIVLDDAKGAECIVAAFSEKPFDRGAVHQRARRAAWFRQSRAPRPNETEPNLALDVLWIDKSR
jgi:hypothetical protein